MSASAATLKPRVLRRKLGLSQRQFWGSLGVTQSGGSRYESGYDMPKPVAELVRLRYLEEIDLKSICGDDWLVIAYLKACEPQTLKTLRAAARAHSRKARTR